MFKVFPKTWGGITYKKVFEGSSLVDRVVEKSPERYSTREKATELLQGVLKEGFIKSIGRSRLFEDGSQLFYWTEISQSTNNMATTVNSRTQVTSLLCCNQIITSRLMIGHDTTPSPIRAPLPYRIIQISVKMSLVLFCSWPANFWQGSNRVTYRKF